MSHRWLSRSLLALLPCVALVQFAQALEPTLTELSLLWARGDFRAPLVCEIEGEPRRGLRRVRIGSGSRHERSMVDRITFYDLDVPEGTRCFSELRGDVPNVIGTLTMTFPRHRRPDMATHDFELALRRKRGFDYDIREGALILGPSTKPVEEFRKVDFSGGKATLRLIEKGSDTARLLSEFEGQRRLTLTLEAPDETALVFDLVKLPRP